MRRGWSRRIETALALAGYLGFALTVTWPWVLHPRSTLYGVVGSDLTSGVAWYQQLADHRHLPFLPGRIPDLNAPEGVEVTWVLELAGFGNALTRWVLSVALGSIAAHGIVAVLGFALSAFAMFLLVRWVTGHAGIAFVTGLPFGFWPFTYVTGWTWPHYIHLWVFVLLIWRMHVVVERPTLRNGVFAGAAAVFAMTWIQYHLLIAGVLYATLAAIALAATWRKGRFKVQLQAQAVAALMVIVTAVTLLGLARLEDFEGVPARPESDAVLNSARPLMYLLPGPLHPLMGDSTGQWLAEKYVGPTHDPTSTATYASIYLGVPLILVGLGGVVWTLRRIWRARVNGLAGWQTTAGVAAIVIGLVGLMFSAPPRVTLLGVAIPMPYAVVTEFTTVFRVAHRFAILVMLALCVVAALGLVAALRDRSRQVQAAVLIPLALIFAVDLSGRPSPRTTRVDPPPVYELLARQPAGIVAEYPLYAFTISESLFQDVHEHPLFAGYTPDGIGGQRKIELQFLREKRTVPDLAAYGVRYVIVHDIGKGAPKWLPRPGDVIRGLEEIGGNETAVLYRVVAPASRATTYAVSGFGLPEGEPPNVFRWMSENGAKLEVRAACRRCEGTLEFRAASFARARTVVVLDGRGHVLARELVRPDEATQVRVPLRFSRRMVLTLNTEPPPDQINAFVGGPDARRVSIFVGQPVRFILENGRP
jgi:hypothetical protein